MRVTLGEGNTPLVESVRIGPLMGMRKLYFKIETVNPTGSYKDRFIAAEVGRLVRAGATSCVATSSGNTGAALAAYCARYEIQCTVLVDDHAPAGKLVQMQAHGARVIRVKDFIQDPAVTARTLEILQNYGAPLVVSAYRYCPEGMLGTETIGREILAQAPKRVRHIFVPAGGCGLYIATVRGTQASVRVHAVQPEGCSTMVAAYQRGDGKIVSVKNSSRISGLTVPYDIDATTALHELKRCGGTGVAVSDESVWQAQIDLLGQEGIYCEPAGATALAGLRAALERKTLSADEDTVCLVTGSGFKDPDSVARAAHHNPVEMLEVDEIKKALDHPRLL
jgi:threonine synthase